MSTSKLLRFAALTLLTCAITVPAAFAQTPEYSTIDLTEPTSVGDKVLQPGQYLIRVLPGFANRNRVQVTNMDKSTIYTTLLTVPHAFGPNEEKPNTTLVFYPAFEGQPRTLRTWFAPSPVDNEGHDIVYDEARAQILARAAGTPVVTYRGPVVVTDATDPDLQVVTPDSTFKPYVTETPVRTASMPRTAGKLPLFMLLGAMSIAGAFVLRAVNR